MSDKPRPLSRLMTMREVSAETGIEWETLRRWRKNGEGPPAGKFGSSVRYRAEDVQAWIDEHFQQESA